ncbi:MAG: hypothetical protein O2856_03675 [Planctomycetota bacterium]|nr:hypothetical protein [Planctomycetota bacterium]
MYFRFAAGLLLVVLVSMAGVWLEKQTLEMRRTVSVQYYQTDILLDLLVRLRLETQQLTAPAQLAAADKAKIDRTDKEQANNPRRNKRDVDRRQETTNSSSPRLPLLRFQHPFNPEGID